MKPMGAVPADYRGEDGLLMIGGQSALAIVERFGSPVFVYDLNIIRDRIARFRAAFPSEVSLHYAIKANPYSRLLENIVENVDGFDVASQGEMETVLATGISPDHVSMAGPGKRDDELAAAISAGITVNLESGNEAGRALAIASQLGKRPASGRAGQSGF